MSPCCELCHNPYCDGYNCLETGPVSTPDPVGRLQALADTLQAIEDAKARLPGSYQDIAESIIASELHSLQIATTAYWGQKEYDAWADSLRPVYTRMTDNDLY